MTKLSTPLGHDAGTPRWRCRQHSRCNAWVAQIRCWGAGSKTGVPGSPDSRLRRRGEDWSAGSKSAGTSSSETQFRHASAPPLGECQKLSVSPVSDHQRQAMSVIPAVRQDSDEEPRPEKPLLMDASRKWFLPAVPDVGYRMWAAGRNHHLNREVHIAKASDDVTKMSTPGRRSNRDSPTSDASSEKFQTTGHARIRLAWDHRDCTSRHET